MKNALIFSVLLFLFIQVQAQDELEYTTYFAEQAQFKIDLPDKWSSAVVEKKIMMGYNTAITSLDGQEEGTILIVNSIMGCRSPANEAKTYKKIFEKTAKKSNDSAFRIIAEGEEEDKDGKNYYWIDFIHTLKLDDGRELVLRELFVARCHFAGMNKYANTFRFQTLESNWEKNKPIFDEIYSSVRYSKTK